MIFLITTCVNCSFVNAKNMNSFRECVVIMGAGLGGTNIEDIFGSLWLSAYQSSATITTSRPTSESSSKELNLGC